MDAINSAAASGSDVIALLSLMLALLGIAGIGIYLAIKRQVIRDVERKINVNQAYVYVQHSLHLYQIYEGQKESSASSPVLSTLNAAIKYSDDALLAIDGMDQGDPKTRLARATAICNKAYFLAEMANSVDESEKASLLNQAKELIKSISATINRMAEQESEGWWDQHECRIFVYFQAGVCHSHVKDLIVEYLKNTKIPPDEKEYVLSQGYCKKVLTDEDRQSIGVL